MQPRRADKRAVVAKDALVRAAERLIGAHGVDAVSLRQIASEAGLSNNYATQYHFGGKAELVDAIFSRRLAQVETCRAALKERAIERGMANDPRVLVEIIYRPVMELRDETGRRTYAAFLLALQQSDDDYWFRYDFFGRSPVAREAKAKLVSAASHVPEPLLWERRSTAATVVFNGLVQRDRRGRNLDIDDLLIEEAIDSVVAIVTAPVAYAFATTPDVQAR